MNKQTITFTASEQTLTKTGGIEHYASNIVSYIEASFTLGDNWAGYDSIRAVWESGYARIATVLDANNKCIVPAEVLTYKSKVNVNLVGSIVENAVLTDRLTTYPILALTVDADARVDSSETTPVTASQFEQFVDVVRDEASAIQNYTYDSEAWAVGQRAGVDVPSTDETYHNNAKYYADQGATLQQEVTDLKSASNAIENETSIYPVHNSWVKGDITASGVIIDGDNAISSIIPNLALIDLASGCKAVVFVYSGTTVIGKVNTNYNLDTNGGSSGTWLYFENQIDVQSILAIPNAVSGNADGIRVVVVPTDGTTITDADTYGNSKVTFTPIQNRLDHSDDSIERIKTNIDFSYPDERIWIKRTMGADGSIVVGNGAVSNILHNISNVTFDSSAKAVLFLYSGSTYIGKSNSSYNIDKVAGSWGYFTDSIPIDKYFEKYEADGFRLVVVPTDESTLDATTISEWAESHVSFTPLPNKMDGLSILENEFEEKVYNTESITEFIKGGYTRNGTFDPTPNTLRTSSDYVPEGFDTINIVDGYLGILFAFDDNNVFYGGMYSDHTLSGGFYSGNFYFVNEIDIGFFQKAFPDLNYKLIIKKSDGSNFTNIDDLKDKVILLKTSVISETNVDEKINGINPLGGFGYARDYFYLSIGHRGGDAYAPENTLPSFISGAEKGLLYVETDVAYTSDDVPVLLHDLTINRTARNADGSELENTVYIANITYSQAYEYDYGIYKGDEFAGTKIMKFDEFISLCKQLALTPMIELKRESLNDPDIHTQTRVNNLVNIVKSYGMQHHVFWGSFDTETIARVLKADKNATVGIAISGGEISDPVKLKLKVETLKAFKQGGNYVYATVRTDQGTTAVHEMLAENNIPVIEYFINTTAEALEIADHVATIGGMTDWYVNIGKAIKDSVLDGN